MNFRDPVLSWVDIIQSRFKAEMLLNKELEPTI